MLKKDKNRIKRRIVNVFGGLGYAACLLQFLWAILLYYSVITNLVLLFNDDKSNQAPQIVSIGVDSGQALPGFSVFAIFISVIVVLAVLAMMVYAIYRIPKTVVQKSERVVHETAKKFTQIVLHLQHKKETKKNLISLTPRIIMTLKFVFVLLIMITIYCSRFVKNEYLSFGIAEFIGVWLTIICLALFALQYLLGKILGVNSQDLI